MKRRKNVYQGYEEVICNCCLVDRIRWPILPCISYNAISDTMITTYCWLTQKEITFVVGTSTSCRERACDRSVFRRLLKPNERFIVTASMIKATTMRRNDRDCTIDTSNKAEEAPRNFTADKLNSTNYAELEKLPSAGYKM